MGLGESTSENGTMLHVKILKDSFSRHGHGGTRVLGSFLVDPDDIQEDKPFIVPTPEEASDVFDKSKIKISIEKGPNNPGLELVQKSTAPKFLSLFEKEKEERRPFTTIPEAITSSASFQLDDAKNLRVRVDVIDLEQEKLREEAQKFDKAAELMNTGGFRKGKSRGAKFVADNLDNLK